MSSCHLLLGRPLDLFPLLGCHFVQRVVHLLSFILAICPAHLHFCFSVSFIMTVIFVLFLISEHCILSCSFRHNIFLSTNIVSYLVALDTIFSSPFFCSLSGFQFVCQLFIERPCLAAKTVPCCSDPGVDFYFCSSSSSTFDMMVALTRSFLP